MLVAVAQELKGRQIGRRMLTEAEGWAKENGFNCVYVESLKKVIKFYEKCGYVQQHETMVEAPILTLLKKDLK